LKDDVSLRGFDDLRQLLITRLGIQEAMIIVRTKNELPRFRDALTLSVLILVLPAVYSAQEADRFQDSLPPLQAGRLIDVEPQLGPQPPCGKEPIPPYVGLDDLAIVKSWSKSDFSRDWKPPACTSWAEVGFTTLVTIAARFPHTSEASGLLRHIGAISELAGMRYWSTTHKQWRKDLLDKAECVIVLPSVLKFAIGFGGSYGRGVMTCRSGKEFSGPWSAPSMMALEGGSFGLQLGGQATDFVLLVMNRRGADSILTSQVKLGGGSPAWRSLDV
jgi:hypothetical protein